MICCCENPTFLGCFDPCYPINTNQSAQVLGNHTIEYTQNGNDYSFTYEVTVVGQSIVLPCCKFNERATIHFSIKQPGGAYLLSPSGSNCFSFKTRTTKEV